MRPDGIKRTGLAALAAAAALVAGCLSPERAEETANADATALATALWRERTGVTNEFSIARPADVLTLRLALEALRGGATNAPFPRIAGVDPFAPSNGVVHLSLLDALALGARHSREYQAKKEAVYLKAIALDTERYAFETTFSGMILGALSGSPEVDKMTASAGGDSQFAHRKFEQGATVAGNMAVDVARMIRDDWNSFAWTGDLTVSIPLLRGAGRDIVREALTQAERDLAYAICTFERYRQTYALSVAKAYFAVLKNAQTHANSGDNAKRLQLNYDRAEMMFKAGRMTRIEFDQAKTDLLGARQTMITSMQTYQDALDNFKITLGCAPEAPVALKDAELRRLEKRMEDLAAARPEALADYPAESAALLLALDERRDLAVVRGQYEDAERTVKVKADALRADLTVEGGASYDGSRRQHQNVDDATATAAKLKFSMPWDRRRERNAYRRAQVARDQAARDLQEKEDAVKNAVRAGYRELEAARALYANKAEACRTAYLRVEANDLFTQSGRSSMRDILEAESALLSARNALCSAVVEWWASDLSLQSALGTLDVRNPSTWK